MTSNNRMDGCGHVSPILKQRVAPSKKEKKKNSSNILDGATEAGKTRFRANAKARVTAAKLASRMKK